MWHVEQKSFCSLSRRRCIYTIPLSCGRFYIGQTEQGLDRLKEHFNLVGGTPSGRLSVHCNRCVCTVLWDQVSVEAKYKEKSTREIHEALLISKERDSVSAASLALSDPI